VPVVPRPKRLGPYDVVVKIAGGGMATIYIGRAREENGEERVAAVKVIRHELRHDAHVVRMFLDEAKILARLSHPNIAQTYESGSDEDLHFIAMELLVGRTLKDVWEACRDKQLSLRLDLAAWIGARVADALAYAHDLKGDDGEPLHLVHRDVNPSNIFLTHGGEVKLFDFGLAKAVGRNAKSQVGIVKGKLPYLSPEQVSQTGIDGRSDVFMLGTTVWELTTMLRLFKRADDIETLHAVRAALVPDPRASVPTYPDELRRTVKRALERDPDERYTAAEFARALDAFVDAQGTRATMPALVGAILEELFPGERQKQALWLRRSKAPRAMAQRTTMAPPAPLAGTAVSMPPLPPPPLPPKRRSSSKMRARKPSSEE
jgi:serine/threonine-protein kinase